MRRCGGVCLTALVFLVVSMAVAGCGGGKAKSEDLAGLNGSWKNEADGKTVEFNLSGENKTVTINGSPVPVTISQNVGDEIHLSAVNGQGKTEDWKLKKVWNDNGSAFTLNFFHNGVSETLVRS
jgi:hypothetical protein